MGRFNVKKNNNAIKPRHIGEVRKSQLITTFGIGSIVDFVRDTAIIGGVDDWDNDSVDPNWANRKLANENLQSITGTKYFISPKSSSGNLYSKASQDIKAYTFPESLYCPVCKSIVRYTELKNNAKSSHIDSDGNECKGTLVAARFVLVCDNGHLEDFPYSWWVHRGHNCKGKDGTGGKPYPRITMFNVGDRSDMESLQIKCSECGEIRGMESILNKGAFGGENWYPCKSSHPHIRSPYKHCDKMMVAKLRTSTSVYFSHTQSALLIPPWSQKAVELVEQEFDKLSESYMTDESRHIYIKNHILKKCKNTTVEKLLKSYETIKQHRETGIGRNEIDVYNDEYEVLCSTRIDDDDGKYSSHTVDIPQDFNSIFETISVVDRLVVTKSLCGFTRNKPYDGDNDLLAPLSSEEKEWLPAVELCGEGIFFKFSKAAVQNWLKNIANRYDELKKSYYNQEIPSAKTPKFSDEYILLHTFAHLFIRQVANECGYSAASMSEKIYSTFKKDVNSTEMCGVLIYLTSSDSDGSLGGLISVAEDTEMLEFVLKNMLREAVWCSGDPLCVSSEHQGFNSLNYAACHDCTLLPETSCEFRNVLLDRVSVVGKIENPNLGIFGELVSKF